MQSKATTVAAYLKSLPADRREAIEAVRDVINKNLPKGYEEGMQYGMIGWYVPHSRYPAGYHCDPKQPLPFASLASQKNHMAIYLFCLYQDEGDEVRFREAWEATGNKLDMGKSCVRFKKIENVPLKVVGQAVKVPVKKFIERYETVLNESGAERKARRDASKKTTKKQVSKKPAKKATSKKTAKKTAKKSTTKKKTVKRAATRR